VLAVGLLVFASVAVAALVGVGVPEAVVHWWSCQGESGGQPAWSPDGRLLAFRRSGSIWLVHPDGTALRRLTRGTCDGDAHPSWAPDGRRIVFGHGDGIWVVNADGSDRHLVTRRGENPAWSPDGNWIVFTRGGALYVVRPDGSRRRMIPTGDDTALSASWAPDSRHIVFAGHGALYVVSRSAPGREYVSVPANDHVGVGNAAWSTDGHITFSAPDGIDIIDPTTGKTRTIVNDEANAYDPSWSPDGSRIAFYEYGGGILVVNRDGSGLRKIAGA
jgi:Tol biopolymer transport system component